MMIMISMMKMFKQMLSNDIEQGDTTIQYLDTKEKIQFVR